MIQSQTYLNVADNSGVKKIMCIKILGNNKKYGIVGDILIGVAKQVISTSLIKRSSIVRALIVRTKKNIIRNYGNMISFEDNAVVLLNNENNLKGSRIFGPIAQEIRHKNFLKIVSLAKNIL